MLVIVSPLRSEFSFRALCLYYYLYHEISVSRTYRQISGKFPDVCKALLLAVKTRCRFYSQFLQNITLQVHYLPVCHIISLTLAVEFWRTSSVSME